MNFKPLCVTVFFVPSAVNSTSNNGPFKLISFVFQKPERAAEFHVDLTGIASGNQALINRQLSSALIKVLESDFPNGTISFPKDVM